MTSHNASASRESRSPAEIELVRDRRRERLMLWKGVFAALVVIAVVLVRQYYWV